MLAGRLPLGGQSPLALYQQKSGQGIEDPVLYNPMLPPGVVDVLRWLTADNPAERAHNAAEPVTRLLGLLDTMPVEIIRGPELHEADETGLQGQLADANNLLANALKTWSPRQPQYPFSRQYALISRHAQLSQSARIPPPLITRSCMARVTA
jgi:hypothetical protein